MRLFVGTRALILLIVTCSAIPKLAFGQNIRHANIEKRLAAILDGFSKSRLPNRQDISFLVQIAKADDWSQSAEAILMLAESADHHLYPRDTLLSIVETKATYYSGKRSLMFVREYRNFLSIGASNKHRTQFDQILYGHKDPHSIDLEEKQYIGLALSDFDPTERTRAGEILACKMYLDSRDYSWALSRVGEQIHRSNGRFKQFWSFIERLLLAKEKTKNRRVEG